MKILAIVLVVLVILFAIGFATGAVFFTTRGCTLPLDLVLGDTCFFGSLGASLGASVAATIGAIIFFGILGWIGAVIKRAISGKTTAAEPDETIPK